MKKSLLVMLGLVAVVMLAACGNKDVDNGGDEPEATVDVVDVNDENGGEEVDVTENEGVEAQVAATQKTSLTVQDLDEIDLALFPKAYSYEVYNVGAEEMSDSGQSAYPEDWDHKLLLPIHSEMVSREVVSSEIQDGMIYTMVNVVLNDGSVAPVLYINDPETLQYVAASVDKGTETILYIFSY